MTSQPSPADSERDRRSDELRPTWDLYRRLAESTENDARREAVLWALDQLEVLMGPAWLERYFNKAGHVPEEVNLGSGHVVATGHLLDLALRYHVLKGVPGVGKVQREMKNDLRDERRWHSALQLEVASLAVRTDFTVALEAPSPPPAGPSDVSMRRDGRELRVETFAVLRDQQTQEATAYWDRFSRQTLWISGEFNVGISGDVGEQLSDDEYTELLRLIRLAAGQVVATGQTQTVEYASARLNILPPGHKDGYRLTGAVEESQGWPRIESRLAQKAEQAAGAGGGWLRADIRDGMWMFTPWAQAGLREKIETLADLVTSALRGIPGIDGAVLSSGAAFAQGEFYGESARTGNDCYGIRRLLPAARVRETMIIPVTQLGREQSIHWLEMYNNEGDWLDWALGSAGLPARDQIFGGQ
jgi:hypothetical protein